MIADADRPAAVPTLGERMRRAQNGDRHALDGIIDELMPLVWNVARAQGLNADAASDVAQSAWLAFVESLSQIRAPEAVAGWLITVTKRLAWHERERSRRDDHIDPPDWPDPAGNIDDAVADDEQNLCLWRNLRRLEPDCQELLRIAAFVDRPNYKAIAESLSRPVGSIRVMRKVVCPGQLGC
ncbi:MAG TPA: sigma-70 family RNA polymerase sigma factor [Pseudonocardiaceae bacterium]|nr:sigma-70 family RNA polymerase sigma factor [Pseudonocardiaceae bacterium]